MSRIGTFYHQNKHFLGDFILSYMIFRLVSAKSKIRADNLSQTCIFSKVWSQCSSTDILIFAFILPLKRQIGTKMS